MIGDKYANCHGNIIIVERKYEKKKSHFARCEAAGNCAESLTAAPRSGVDRFGNATCAATCCAHSTLLASFLRYISNRNLRFGGSPV